MVYNRRVAIFAVLFALLAGLAVVITKTYLQSRLEGQVAGVTDPTPKSLKGIILPHHELAQPLLLDAMAKIKTIVTPSTIVVLSPNHFIPSSPIAISGTQLKDFPLETTLINELAADQQLVIQNDLLDKEHGLFVPMNYLTSTYPNTRFIPIMISPLNYNETTVTSLTAALVNSVPPDTIYVVSTDFAHNLQVQPALVNNQVTIDVIKQFNYSQLLTMDDAYLDAPVAMAIFLRIMQLTNATTFTPWQSSHGALILNQPLTQSTSYVTGSFSTLSN